MPKLVLMDSGECVLQRWMFDADKNDMGHLTLKEPAHLAAFIVQLQEALDRDVASYVLTDDRPHPCEFCGRAATIEHSSADTLFCSKRMAIFPKVCEHKWEKQASGYLRCPKCLDEKTEIEVAMMESLKEGRR